MTLFGTTLSQDQSDVVDLVRAIVDKQSTAVDGDDDATVSAVRQALVDAGLWTLGVADEHGGGGAPFELRLTALCAIASRWTTAAWCCAQAHAAAEVFGATGNDKMLEHVNSAGPVAVLDGLSPAVQLKVNAGRLTGTLARLDPGGRDAHVLILREHGTVWWLPPAALSAVRRLRCTGMAGAYTMCADVDVELDAAMVLSEIPVDDILARLRLAGAAIAAGIALECAERSLTYARGRIQFGAPLTRLPTVRSALFRQAQTANDSLTLALNSVPSPMAAVATLAGNCERAIEAAAGAVQSHGGYGYLAEYTVERLLRDAISLRAASGVGHGLVDAATVLADESALTAAR